jgi:hypothetical protein
MNKVEVKKKTNLKNYVGDTLNSGLTEAQEMWIEIIVSVVLNPRFNMGIGNMDYVLGNMVAKFVSSARYYKITDCALEYIRSIGIDSTKPLHIKKYIYGKKKNTILEHIIPASIIKNAIVNNRENEEEVRRILNNSGFVIIATRAEDNLLKEAKLAQKMPENWSGFGDSPEKRYNAVNIKISTRLIEHIGPICR